MRDKTRKIQIPEELFYQLVVYFFAENYGKESYIKNELEKKLDALVLHDLYTKSKSALSKEEREQARQEYLEKVGIPEDFRW
jgi:hypothetical protein